MRFLDYQKGAWVALPEGIEESVIRERVLGCQVCISDLDNTDVRSPAVLSAELDLFSRRSLEPEFIGWCARTGIRFIESIFEDGEGWKVSAWEDYFSHFLKSKPERERLEARLRAYGPERLVYQGVKEFYGMLPSEAYKCYHTRNIAELTRPFMELFGFEEVITDVRDKERQLREFVGDHPRLERYLVKGDEEVMPKLGLLEELSRQGRIELTVINVAPSRSERHIDSKAVNIGRDYRGLVELLSG
jgi:hypothetical protein